MRPHTVYRGSLYAKQDGDMGLLSVRLVSDGSGATLADETQVGACGGGAWTRSEFRLTTGGAAASTANHLEFTVAHAGTVWLQLFSLMQPTFQHRPNGNRIDLMERMAAMHPHFLRLPGGNYLEGDTWKTGTTGRRRWGRWWIGRDIRRRGLIGRRTGWGCWSFWSGARI